MFKSPFFFFFLDSSRTLPPGLIAQNAVLASLPDSWLKRVVLSGNRSIIWPVDVCIYIYYACKHIMIYIYIHIIYTYHIYIHNIYIYTLLCMYVYDIICVLYMYIVCNGQVLNNLWSSKTGRVCLEKTMPQMATDCSLEIGSQMHDGNISIFLKIWNWDRT